MFVGVFTSFLVIILSVRAAKGGGDDEWVHLPNKCEGKCVEYQPGFQKHHTRNLEDLVRLEIYDKISLQFRYVMAPTVL